MLTTFWCVVEPHRLQTADEFASSLPVTRPRRDRTVYGDEVDAVESQECAVVRTGNPLEYPCAVPEVQGELVHRRLCDFQIACGGRDTRSQLRIGLGAYRRLLCSIATDGIAASALRVLTRGFRMTSDHAYAGCRT